MQLAEQNPPGTETARQAVHMLVASFALLLRWLSYPQALACAAGLVIFNAFILPRLPGSRRYLYRAEERERGFSVGILAYPVSVFILILVFPVPVAAAMWGVLSFGDGMATLVGSAVGRRHLPWNPKKTLEGMLAFVLGALPPAAFLYWWTLPNVASSPPWWRSPGALDLFGSPGLGAVIAVSLVTAVACAFLETLETRLDDNLVAPLGGACVMVGLACIFF
jgi:dolichol kinase